MSRLKGGSSGMYAYHSSATGHQANQFMRSLQIKGFHHSFPIAYILLIAGLVFYGYLRLFPALLSPYVVTQPYLLANGFVPYVNIEDPRMPLLPQVIAWLAVFFNGNMPQTARAIHVITVTALAILVMAYLYKAKGSFAMLSGSVFFLSWSLVFGYWATAYYEVILGLFYFLIFALVTRNDQQVQSSHCFLIGLLSALGLLIKQHTAVLSLVILIWLLRQLWHQDSRQAKRLSHLLAYGAGAFIPIGAYSVYYASIGGDFAEMFYWTVAYIFQGGYGSMGRLAPTNDQVTIFLPLLLLLLPFLASLLERDETISPQRSERAWVLIFLAAALLFLVPRYSSRHLAAAFPFAAIIAGITSADIFNGVHGKRSLLHASIALALVIWFGVSAAVGYRAYYLQRNERNFSEFSYLLPLAAQVKENISPQSGLVIVPADEGVNNLYYLLDTTPPGYHFDFYPWFINARTTQNWLEATEAEQPETLLYFPGRLDLNTYAPEITRYIQEHYTLIKDIAWEGGEVQLMSRLEDNP